jgi:hypothetical protein
MVGNYSAQGDNTVTGSEITCLSLTAAAASPRRGEIYEFQYGFSGTLENSMCYLRVSRCTDAGTGSGVTPSPLDQDDAASTIVATRNHTAEPSGLTPDMFDMPLNTQAKDRWVSVPGRGLIIPATTTDGFAFSVRQASGSTFTGECEVLGFFQE